MHVNVSGFPDVEDPPFEPRDVQVQNKDVELEFDIYDFLGR